MVTYKDAGVNIEEGYKSVKLMKKHTEKTFIPGVLNNLGSFAGMFELGKYNNPVLVSGTDGVGTKLKIALDRKSTRLNSSHANISYAVFCLKKKNITSLTLLDDIETSLLF